MTPFVEIRNATVYRGSTRVFDGLTLKIAAGEHAAILGPNGAGKSTLLKLLTREIYPLAENGGGVRLFGREQWSIWDLRAHLGVVSNDLQYDYAGNTVGLNVIVSGLFSSVDLWSHQHVSAADRERARRLMETLGVAALAQRPFGSMSTGEQRRFLLGRALINDPDTLLLDEPTSGLDLKACFQYLEVIRRLARAGKTLILVTHHIHEIPPEITRVILLKHGRVFTDGNKRSVLTDALLSRLYDTPIRLVELNGFYQAIPG